MSAGVTTRAPVVMTVNGAAVDTSERIEVVNPATALPFISVPDCSQDQLDDAVAGATAAFGPWSRTTLGHRQRILAELVDAIEDHIEELAELITLENGKPLANARGEVGAALGHWRAYASMALEPEVLRSDDERHIELRRVPLGVVGAITAWNYPVLLAAFKVGPALLAGNTVVLKPSPYTPVATLRLGSIVNELLPPGVLQVVSGGDDLGRWMTTHSDISKISFTGSVQTGRAIMAASAPTLKRLTLELGGNDPGIVLGDLDVPARADDLFWAAFSNAGQVCAGLKRLYVPSDLKSEVAGAMAEIAAMVTVGDGFDEAVTTGPIQNKAQFDYVCELFDDALAQGATVAYRGDVPPGPGYFFPITILTNTSEGMRVVDEEPFGPIIPLLTYDDLDDAIARANATQYGLGASVWGEDEGAARVVAGELIAGTVWINTHPSINPQVPFGGRKQSGIGVEASVLGLHAYTDISVLHIKRC